MILSYHERVLFMPTLLKCHQGVAPASSVPHASIGPQSIQYRASAFCILLRLASPGMIRPL